MSHTVLVVDDEQVVLDTLSTWLREAGYNTCIASNGLEGLLAISQNDPDLIVTDVLMPLIDGYELTKMMREMSSAPVLMLTALGLEDDVKLAKRVGADEYLTKPVSMESFLERVSTLLSRGRTSSNGSIELLDAHRPATPNSHTPPGA